MRMTSFTRVWPIWRQSVEQTVGDDADALLQIWGETAYAVAADLSWREESGQLHASAAGHWRSVKQEIGRRIGAGDHAAHVPLPALSDSLA